MKLLHGDCLRLMPRLRAASVDLVLTDPPYGRTAMTWDKELDFEDLWRAYRRVCTGPVVLTASQPFTTMLIASNIKEFRYALVWDKGRGSSPLLANKQPMRSHEDICVFYKKQPTYNPQMTEGAPYKPPRTGGNRTNNVTGSVGDRPGWVQATKDTSKRFPLSVLEFHIHCGSKLHPSQKPLELMEWLVRTYTNPGDTVLDSCMGSGTTGVACANTGRKFIGMELRRDYYEMAKERIEAACRKRSSRR